MKAKTLPCPKCETTMKRIYGYKKAFWQCHVYGYRTVYECPKCKERTALVTMDEAGYKAYIAELCEWYKHEADQASALRITLYNYREKANTAKLNMELDALEKAITRLKIRLKEM